MFIIDSPKQIIISVLSCRKTFGRRTNTNNNHFLFRINCMNKDVLGLQRVKTNHYLDTFSRKCPALGQSITLTCILHLIHLTPLTSRISHDKLPSNSIHYEFRRTNSQNTTICEKVKKSILKAGEPRCAPSTLGWRSKS